MTTCIRLRAQQLYGDANLDGIVNVLDIAAAQAVNNIEPTDVNRDGVTNIYDLLEVLQGLVRCSLKSSQQDVIKEGLAPESPRGTAEFASTDHTYNHGPSQYWPSCICTRLIRRSIHFLGCILVSVLDLWSNDRRDENHSYPSTRYGRLPPCFV